MMRKHDFEVGDGVTVRIGSDCYPATVTHVTATQVTVQHDSVRYGTFAPDPQGSIQKFSVRVDGRLRPVGQSARSNSTIHKGRRFYLDPSF